MSSTNWPRVVASGALWTVVYNFVWAVAWFAFMREEWEQAMAAIRRPLPFTAEVWFLWVVLTLPIGVAIMVYAAGRAHSARRAALSTAGAVWLLMTLGTTLWGRQEALSMRVLTLDSFVNLLGMVAASFAGAWSQRQA